MTRTKNSMHSSRMVSAYSGCNVAVTFANIHLFRRWLFVLDTGYGASLRVGDGPCLTYGVHICGPCGGSSWGLCPTIAGPMVFFP